MCIIRPSIIAPSWVIDQFEFSKYLISMVQHFGARALLDVRIFASCLYEQVIHRRSPECAWSRYPASMPLANFSLSAIATQTSYTFSSHTNDGSNFIDEVPIDYVCNVILAHIGFGTRGVVNACLADKNRHSPERLLAANGPMMPVTSFAPVSLRTLV